MATTSDTPVLDTLAAMTVDSLERCGMDAHHLVLTRLAALAAMDAPPISYLAHVGPAQAAEVTAEQLQDLLVAIAPIIGTARVMSAAGHITEALGFAIAVAESEAESAQGAGMTGKSKKK
ncbi:carboxymuconolactone decarboxylase [Catenulispora subtropica]|uniref:Carboxymuconolactone decarboxylase n=1 Tax=Catenulispora subtropica TaxID=450798 RepID=A0ABP5CTY9_9ACTN